MIGISALRRTGKAGEYFALAILAVSIDVLLSVLIGLALSVPWWDNLLVSLIPSALIAATVALWIRVPREQLSKD